MRNIAILFLLLGIVGCVSLNKGVRQRQAVVTEIRPAPNKSKFHLPKIRKPRIVENKEMDVSNRIEEIVKAEEVNNKPQIKEEQVEENTNVIDRNKRFDNLLEPNKEIKDQPQSLFDRFFTVLGMGGIVIVLSSGVYFILRNFL